MAIGIHGILLNTAQKNDQKMSASALEARRKYYRDYYARTRDRQKQYKIDYWARKAAEAESNATKGQESATKGGE